jgi:hypothetical protein
MLPLQDLTRSEGHVMIWTSDSRWIVLYSTLATLFICSWAIFPAKAQQAIGALL